MAHQHFSPHELARLEAYAADHIVELLPVTTRAHIRWTADGFKCSCPIHGGDDENFHWCAPRRNWTCWSHHCGRGDDVFVLIQKLYRCSFVEAVKRLKAFAGDQLRDDAPPPPVHIPNKTLITVSETLLDSCRDDHPYLNRIAAPVRRALECGYCLNPLYPHLYGRMTFPVRDTRSRLIGITARITGERPPAAATDEVRRLWSRKYLHFGPTPKQSYYKSMVVYHLHHAMAYPHLPLIVVEGTVDVARVLEHGYPAVVAIMGSFVSREQIRLMALSHDRLIYMLDPDTFDAHKEGLPLKSFCAYASDRSQTVHVARLPTGIDPGSMSATMFWRSYHAARWR